ncbi:DUF4232 domain-containing protein [Streptomyces sp. NK08204]|uniref:DUF4232 domain-containing protein n=1 Tax=Streptomyces sp. NK08204 TaxID=2873260 RepID=UPI001CEC70A5|nr:DUF4232 domain-containing protein [Streptomyces sp. NK08204]
MTMTATGETAMHTRARLAVPAAACAAALALLSAAPRSEAVPGRSPAAPGHSRAAGPQARPVRCAEQALVVRAQAAADPALVRVSVTNGGVRACAVDRAPMVTFGDLDGAALPLPAGGTGTYRLGAGESAYAAVRTIGDPADPQGRRVGVITVAAGAFQWGRSFTAGQLGIRGPVRVWEPVTTWWQPSARAADRALAVGLSR